MQIRADTGARIMFPGVKDTEKDLITIIGKQEAVEAAKEELLKKIKDLVCRCCCLFVYSFHELFESAECSAVIFVVGGDLKRKLHSNVS